MKIGFLPLYTSLYTKNKKREQNDKIYHRYRHGKYFIPFIGPHICWIDIIQHLIDRANQTSGNKTIFIIECQHSRINFIYFTIIMHPK